MRVLCLLQAQSADGTARLEVQWPAFWKSRYFPPARPREISDMTSNSKYCIL